MRGLRPSIRRSRVPLHRRLRADPSRLRYWLVVATAAVVAGSVVGHLAAQAEEARAAWGRTQPVWVATRDLRRGATIGSGAARRERWPVALAPPDALAGLSATARAARPIGRGEPLTSRAVAPAPERRRIAVPQPEATLDPEPGDLVDLWATRDPALAADGGAGTERVATDAEVVASRPGVVVVAVRPAEAGPVAEAVATAEVVLAAG